MAGPGAKAAPGGQGAARPVLRLDKWLWHARFFRARGDAADAVSDGKVRLNGQRTLKPGHAVAVGDVLTFVQAGRVRVVRVLALAERRGPASEAELIYEDLDATKPPQTPTTPLE